LKKLEKLDSRLDEALSLMTAAGERSLHKAPIENAWTPLQTLHHIYLAERSSVDYLLYKFGQEEDPPPSNLRTILNGKVLLAAFATPKKFGHAAFFSNASDATYSSDQTSVSPKRPQ